MSSFNVLSLIWILSVLSRVSGLSIVSPRKIPLGGGPVNLTCSADAVDLEVKPHPDQRVFFAKLFHTNTILRPPIIKDQLFYFAPLGYRIGETLSFTKEARGLNWTYTIPTREEVDAIAKDDRYHRKFVKGMLTIMEVSCDDAGMYQCVINKGKLILHASDLAREQPLIVYTVPPHAINLTVEPEGNGNIVTCSVQSLSDERSIDFTLKLVCPLNTTEQNINTNRTTTFSHEYCGAFMHQLVWRFGPVNESLSGCRINCTFKQKSTYDLENGESLKLPEQLSTSQLLEVSSAAIWKCGLFSDHISYGIFPVMVFLDYSYVFGL